PNPTSKIPPRRADGHSSLWTLNFGSKELSSLRWSPERARFANSSPLRSRRCEFQRSEPALPGCLEFGASCCDCTSLASGKSFSAKSQGCTQVQSFGTAGRPDYLFCMQSEIRLAPCGKSPSGCRRPTLGEGVCFPHRAAQRLRR